MLQSRILEFLVDTEALDDSAEEDRRDQLARIQAASSILLREWQEVFHKHEAGMHALQESRQELSVIINKLDNANIEQRKRQLLEEEYKRKLLEMARSIDELERLSTVIGSASATGHENERHVREIQAVVLRMLDSLPHRALPTTSKLFQHMQSKIKHMSESILSHFHSRFENLLDQGETGGNSINIKDFNDEVEKAPENKSDGWAAFLDHSRSWLLAYVMIKLLPNIISASNAMVIESYQEALDEALTPMWGRYRFHLKHSAWSGNKKQIVWAFHYATSITRIFYDLCTHLGESKELLALFSFRDTPVIGSTSGVRGDPGEGKALLSRLYRRAGPAYLLSKSVKLFKAHLAMIVLLLVDPSSAAAMLGDGQGDGQGQGHGDVKRNKQTSMEVEQAIMTRFLTRASSQKSGSSSTASFVMHVVEETLAFDSYQLTLLNHATTIAGDDVPFSTSTSSASASLYSELAVEVLYDSIEIFAVWISQDVSFFRTRLLEAVGSRTRKDNFDRAFDGAFAGFFGNADNTAGLIPEEELHTNNGGSNEQGQQQQQNKEGEKEGKFCYRAVFDTLSLLDLACRRYAAVPAEGAAEFSTWVIEPLLAMLSALLLVKVRSDPVLLELSQGSIPGEMRYAYRSNNIHKGHKGGHYRGHIPVPISLLRLRATVSYLNAAMRAIKSMRVGQGQGQGQEHAGVFCLVRDIATEAGNYPGLWEQTHEWIPRDIATMNDTGLDHVRRDLFPQLVDMVMPECQGPDGGGGEGRGTNVPLVGFAVALAEKRRERSSSGNMPGEGLSSLGASLDHVRAQVITLCSAIDNQYERALDLLERLEK